MKSLLLLFVLVALPAYGANAPARTQQVMVVAAEQLAAQIGVEVMRDGGNAVDAAVAVAFALAVTYPAAGNIGGGGFLVYRGASGAPVAYDFREMAPAAAGPEMWLVDGQYSSERHHESHLSVGVPGTVAGLHLAWQDHGSLPWQRLLTPAIKLAADGFTVSDVLARSLAATLRRLQRFPASLEQYSRDGAPLAVGDKLVQKDLAASLRRIARKGPAGFYQGRTADLLVAEMRRGGGLITHEDLAGYRAIRRTPIRGSYRGYEVLGMPPPSSGGVALVTMLNVLEGYDIAASGFGSARTLHLMAESMRRAFAERARYLGDPDFVEMPLERLLSKAHAAELRATINPLEASTSTPERFSWPPASPQTTHLSVVDADRNAVALTCTLEESYGSAVVVPGAGFLLNNEMGDFNAGAGLTDRTGLIGTAANLAAPGKRMLSSMSPTIVSRDGSLFMVTGTPGGRTIINTVLQTIVNVIDFGLNAQAAVDLGRIHHQWLPDRISYEAQAFSPDTLELLEQRGHQLRAIDWQGLAEVIVVRDDGLEGGVDRREPGGAAAGF